MFRNWFLKDRDNARSDMGVQGSDRYYRCLDCNNVWIGPCPSPCRRCRSVRVTQCSEIVYEQHRDK